MFEFLCADREWTRAFRFFFCPVAPLPSLSLSIFHPLCYCSQSDKSCAGMGQRQWDERQKLTPYISDEIFLAGTLFILFFSHFAFVRRDCGVVTGPRFLGSVAHKLISIWKLKEKTKKKVAKLKWARMRHTHRVKAIEISSGIIKIVQQLRSHVSKP